LPKARGDPQKPSSYEELKKSRESRENYYCKCHTLVIGYDVSTYKRTKMIDTDNPLLQTLADDFVDLHKVGGIELEQWETAYNFVKHFYHTEEYVQIVIGGKK
jgi:hypothetical protein